MSNNNDDCVVKYLPIIKGMALKYYQRNAARGICIEDLVQEGMIAAWKISKKKNFVDMDEIEAKKYISRVISVTMRSYIIKECTGVSQQWHDKCKNGYEDVNECRFDSFDVDRLKSPSREEEMEVRWMIEEVAKKNPETGEIISLLHSGKTYREIETALGISIASISRKVLEARSACEEFLGSREYFRSHAVC